MESQTPEEALTNWAQVHGDYTKLEEFIDWGFERGILELEGNMRKVLDEYFKVDRKALDQGRRNVLQEARQLNGMDQNGFDRT